MPLYRYRCPDCGHEFEELLSGADVTIAVACPSCGVSETERQLTTFAVGSSDRRDEVPFCGRCGENRPPCMGN